MIRVVVLLLMAVVSYGHPQVDFVPRVAVVSAYGPEMVKLETVLKASSRERINGRDFTLGEIEGRNVVTFLSGVSMVNASMTVQVALDHFNVTHILYSGIAGGVNPSLNIGDVVIPARWAQYQETVFARETDKGFDPTWHKVLYSNFGMMFPQEVEVMRLGKAETKFWFDVDYELLMVAGRIKSVKLMSSTPKATLSHVPRLVIGGNGVSGPTFVDNAKYREWVYTTFKADCLDMETAAVAHVAYVGNIPFIAFRSLSDLAGGGLGENEIGTFFGLAADNAANVLIQFMKNWK